MGGPESGFGTEAVRCFRTMADTHAEARREVAAIADGLMIIPSLPNEPIETPVPRPAGAAGVGSAAGVTPYHAQYFAHELTRRRPPTGIDRLSMSLFDARVDLNPHQIEAALFALRSPISKGVILADEVGLGKTIEAGLVLSQHWAERRRRLLVICPASIRKQWSLELEEKFSLPTLILDRAAYRAARADGRLGPFDTDRVVITSMNFASAMQEEVRATQWDLVVIDEAHKLRNAYRQSNRMGQAIRWAIEERRKLLLTATPLQNSLLELYGLSTLIDERLFGDRTAFQARYMRQDRDLDELRARLAYFTKRALRNQVLEYVQYTERRPLLERFRPADHEQQLYEALSAFLLREDTYAIPRQQRTLTTLILRKLLASSSRAIEATLETMRARLLALRAGATVEQSIAESLIGVEEIAGEYLDELEHPEEVEADDSANTESGQGDWDDAERSSASPDGLDLKRLDAEIAELEHYITLARSIDVDTKSRALLTALDTGFREMERVGAARKAVVFTESRRTQEYLNTFLEANGYAGRTVLFSGTNSGPATTAIYEHWLAANRESGRATASRQIDIRTALIEHFRDAADIMIATEAAAEGVNLQFCSLVVNYDLPWNPQRIEQRIGRCHRYGQKHDVVVLNFLNERNEAERRVLELLEEKFSLFDGVFGASDEVLGSIASGVDFERRILDIYQQCRTPEEIDAGFRQLREEMDATIRARMDETRQILLEHFDEDVHARLRMQLEGAREQMDYVSGLFWAVTEYVLRDAARFDRDDLAFELHEPPRAEIRRGTYNLISKARAQGSQGVGSEFLYRLSHPLGEWVLERGKALATPPAEVVFDITNHPTRITDVERLRGHSGWLTLHRLVVESFETEEYLPFSGLLDRPLPDGTRTLDQETCAKLFRCDAHVGAAAEATPPRRLGEDADRHMAATLARAMEANSTLFNQERERLDRWADDMVAGAEKALADTKVQLRQLNRQARLATTTEEQNGLQLKIRDLEREQRRQRQRIFDVEDEIRERRDELIDQLEQRMKQRTNEEELFTIRWRVV